ncbi:MAG TPA: helix-turn-helix domain-containing protein [Oligoflexus sp.]|uniref:helix-turn-helix domain-containing protein n=1 Tax=Oligoflexus sp. TaxID=1971216 RepID=UPI002D731008|nr:helix-turn-helix domain-containing protein [Oligoflexus sp.]HYX36487.1 helix-turn-helix domain-containing protein [Oligoflexus sp.]
MTPQELIDARNKLKLTQAQLGAKLGLHPKTIGRYENGGTPIEPWLVLAMESLQRDIKDMLPAALVRTIRNATTIKDLARIKAMMGLAEPEIPFTREQLQKAVDELMEGLYFNDANEDEWWEVLDGEANDDWLTPSEYARRFVDKWLDENFLTTRGRPIEIRHMVRSEVQSFFYDIIFYSQDDFPDEVDEDSRDPPIANVDSWLDGLYAPFTIQTDDAE